MEITVEKVNNAGQNQKRALNTLNGVRVAVYARVSTDQEIQLHSLDEQMKGFKMKIAQNPGWVLVDVYSHDAQRVCRQPQIDGNPVQLLQSTDQGPVCFTPKERSERG